MPATMTMDDYFSPELWGKDHWSTLGYVENVMVDCVGFQVGNDARMRSNRRHSRIMAEQCPTPMRSGRDAMCIVMDQGYGTVLKNGSMVDQHDDWCCVQDMAHAGLFMDPCTSRIIEVEDIEPGVTLHLSPKGRDLCDRLRAHKASGGTFATFSPPVAEAVS